MDEIRSVLEKLCEQDRFSGKKMFNDLNILLNKGSTSKLLNKIKNILGDSCYEYILTSLIRNIFLIELVNDDISSTKMEVRWVIKESKGKKQEKYDNTDPRFCSFQDCLKIFLKLLEELRSSIDKDEVKTILILYQKYNILPYELPLDYMRSPLADHSITHIHTINNINWIWDETYKKTLELREILMDSTKNTKSDLFSSILKDKIKVKTYLTDRVQTGVHKTNREKRWEVHPESVHFASRRECFFVERKLISQLSFFVEFPKEIFDLVKDKIILEANSVYRCPVTLEPLNFPQFENEVKKPLHGKSIFHVGHLNPLKLKTDDPTSGHTYQNIGWFSEEGNRIQGNLSIKETRKMLSRIIKNYEDAKILLE